MDVNYVFDSGERVQEHRPAYRGFEVRRVVLPSSAQVTWTLIGPDLRPVRVVDEFLAHLTLVERSPNTVEAYARDLKAFWTWRLLSRLASGARRGGFLNASSTRVRCGS